MQILNRRTQSVFFFFFFSGSALTLCKFRLHIVDRQHIYLWSSASGCFSLNVINMGSTRKKGKNDDYDGPWKLSVDGFVLFIFLSDGQLISGVWWCCCCCLDDDARAAAGGPVLLVGWWLQCWPAPGRTHGAAWRNCGRASPLMPRRNTHTRNATQTKERDAMRVEEEKIFTPTSLYQELTGRCAGTKHFNSLFLCVSPFKHLQGDRNSTWKNKQNSLSEKKYLMRRKKNNLQIKSFGI